MIHERPQGPLETADPIFHHSGPRQGGTPETMAVGSFCSSGPWGPYAWQPLLCFRMRNGHGEPTSHDTVGADVVDMKDSEVADVMHMKNIEESVDQRANSHIYIYTHICMYIVTCVYTFIHIQIFNDIYESGNM